MFIGGLKMAVIAVTPETNETGEIVYRAVEGDRYSIGRTPGQALDALGSEVTGADNGTFLVSRLGTPDRFFTYTQQERLADLMSRWKSPQQGEAGLTPDEFAELEDLVQAELQATIDRTAAMRPVTR